MHIISISCYLDSRGHGTGDFVIILKLLDLPKSAKMLLFFRIPFYSLTIKPLEIILFVYSQAIVTFFHFIFPLISFLELVQGTSEGKRALYHCNYCNKDITGKIRIKCAICPDFDLCIECFSVGAEVTPHKSNHPYRVMVSKMPPGNIFSCPDNLLNCQFFFWFISLMKRFLMNFFLCWKICYPNLLHPFSSIEAIHISWF